MTPPVVEVDRLLVYIPGVVGVYRKCRTCGRWARLRGHHRRCDVCAQPVRVSVGQGGGQTRSMALTDKGRAMCAQLRAEDAA